MATTDNSAGYLPPRPDPSLSDPAREALRILFWRGALQSTDLPTDGLAELAQLEWVEQVKGWWTITPNGLGAALNRGYGREKERQLFKEAVNAKGAT